MPNSTVSNSIFEKKFEVHRVAWELDEDVPLDSLKIRDTAQVRALSEVAPADQVNLYAIQMAAGEVFPPIVLWQDVVIDGNTRLRAAGKAGLASLPAYRLACRNESHAKQIAASLNQTNGRQLNTMEARMSALLMLADGYSDAFIARELGMDASKVRRWRREEDVREHADRVGVTEQLANVAATTRAKLADISHDAPFRALVDALDTYAVPTDDVNEVLDEVRRAPSDDVAVQLIEERTEGWQPRGERRPGKGPRVTAREANRSISALTKHPLSYWVDVTVRDEQLPRWRELADLAAAVIAEYERLA
jgi:ParB-like chromosome segregation protein Spo0J